MSFLTLKCRDKFTGHNWERYANISGLVSVVACLLFGVISLLAKYDVGTSVYTIIMAFLILPLESTMVDMCTPFMMCKRFLNETLRLDTPIVRALLYTCMAIGMFAISVSPCIAGGIFVMITVVLLIFAQCNKMQDDADAARSSGPSATFSTQRASLSRPLDANHGGLI